MDTRFYIASTQIARRSLVDSSGREARVPDAAVVDGDVTVEVHSDGPLRTTLTTKRHTPGQRHTDSLLVG